MSSIELGDRVKVTATEYTRAAPVGTVGVVTRVGEDEGRVLYTIDREDGKGFGWAHGVERVQKDGA